MRQFDKLLGLSREEQLLLAKTVPWVIVVRVGLWLLPLKDLEKWLSRPMARTLLSHCFAGEATSVGKLSWVVRIASRAVPRATCLTQALVMRLLLERWDQPAQLRIGVVKDKAGRLEAHAWLECHGAIVIGDLVDLSRFRPLPLPKEGQVNEWYLRHH